MSLEAATALLEAPAPYWVDSSDGVRLPVTHLGARDSSAPEATSRPIVLIAHATGFHGRVYDPLVDVLSGFEPVTVDLRGHGDSRAPSDLDYRWDSFADDLLAVVRALDGQRTLDAKRESLPSQPLFGFGHSMGAACLLMAEQRAPGSFAGLYCYEPVVHPPEATNESSAPTGGSSPRSPTRISNWIERTEKRRGVFDSTAAARANFASKPPYQSFNPRALDAYIEHGFAADADGALRIKCRPVVEAQIYRMGPRHGTWAGLKEVRCPVIIARGSVVQPGPSAWAERIAGELPNAELEVFQGLGHLGPLEDPQRVGDQVARFFRSTL